MANNQFPTPPSAPPPAFFDENTTLVPPEEIPPIPPNYQAPDSIAPPVIRESPFKIIVPVVLVLLVLGLIGFFVLKFLNAPKPAGSDPKNPTTITYWGLWETPSIMKPVIDTFESANPGIKVNYQLQSQLDYQERANTALDSQKPPDVIRLHSTWLPVFYTKLIPAPANTISETEIKTNFYPAARQLVLTSQVYGVPMTMEGLALFINTKMFEAKSLSAPKTWEDLATAAKSLTVRDSATGKITRAGVALGNTKNVDLWPDIVSLMLLQGGSNLLNPSEKSLTSTLKYYNSFAGAANGVWDSTLPNSTLAFANEKVAMILAPSWKAVDIQTINPSLAWKVAPAPQLPEVEPINWTSFWFEAVPKNSTHTEEAWKFVTFLSSAKAQQLLFESASKERGFSQVPANKSVASLAQQNPIIAAFVESMPTAQTFYTASLTHDSSTGLNARLIKYLEDALNGSVNGGQDAAVVAATLSNGFNQVLSQYRLVKPFAAPVAQ